VVSLFAFVMTAHGLNPYLIATFNSGFACENTRTQLMAAALDPSFAGASTYSMPPRLQCITTPGLVAGGSRLPDAGTAPRASTSAQPNKKPAKK